MDTKLQVRVYLTMICLLLVTSIVISTLDHLVNIDRLKEDIRINNYLITGVK